MMTLILVRSRISLYKIYFIKKILRDYYIEYKNITEKIDGNPKYKSLKPNQITQMKEEREKQLEGFSPILEVIKPFIDFINGEKIINNELKGYKYDLKEIKRDIPLDYEPTENEIDDITLPIKISDNYTFGNTILNAIEIKYSNNKDINKENNETIKDNLNININKENNNLSKWNYITYKLSLIGYPLSGRKFIVENLNKKFPNMKIPYMTKFYVAKIYENLEFLRKVTLIFVMRFFRGM